jgi:Flp pilus assembly protein TadD
VQLTAAPIELRTSRADSAAAAKWRRQAAANLGEELAGSDPQSDRPGAALLGSDPAVLVAELQAVYEADPTPLARRNLAWAYLRDGRADEARGLLLTEGERRLAPADLRLVLEAERHLGSGARARDLARSLATDGEPLPDAQLWSLVAVICLDHGWQEDARLALDEALRLDPDNASLRQLRSHIEAG